VVAIISKDATFTPQTPISGFTTIAPGMNLVSTSVITGAQFTGDVSNALTVGGVAATSFLRSDQADQIDAKLTINSDNGLVVGGDSDFTVNVASGTSSVEMFNNVSGNDINFYVNKAGTNTQLINLDGASGAVTLSQTNTSTAVGNGALVVAGGVGVAENLNVGGVAKVTDTTASSSKTTGAVIISGGVGIAGAVFSDSLETSGNVTVGGDLTVTGSLNVEVDSETTILDQLTVQNAATLQGNTTITSTTQSTSVASGALTVDGGVGIDKNLYVGGNFNVTGSINTSSGLVVGNTIPTESNVTTLGNTTHAFGTVYAKEIMPLASNVGNIGSSSLQYDVVHARALQALYADLAEKYTTDQEYEVGTVVAIGGTQEATAATFGDRAIGAVSANPAYLMNAGAPGQMIALKGRVPVKVQGTINKGDKLVPAENMFGSASSASNDDHNYFAIALENHQSGAGIIECLIL
jgi:cytoskeletal protein CcmA (bactofilin family)